MSKEADIVLASAEYLLDRNKEAGGRTIRLGPEGKMFEDWNLSSSAKSAIAQKAVVLKDPNRNTPLDVQVNKLVSGGATVGLTTYLRGKISTLLSFYATPQAGGKMILSRHVVGKGLFKMANPYQGYTVMCKHLKDDLPRAAVILWRGDDRVVPIAELPIITYDAAMTSFENVSCFFDFTNPLQMLVTTIIESGRTPFTQTTILPLDFNKTIFTDLMQREIDFAQKEGVSPK